MKREVLIAVVVSISLLTLQASTQAQTYIFGRADFPVGNSPSTIVAADFNNDGVLDLAVTNNSDNTISVLLGRPDGTFSPQVAYPTGVLPVAIVAGDFNGDGNLDLAVTNGNCTPGHVSPIGPPQCSSSTIGIFLGNGDGSFQPQVTYPAGTLPASIVTADFNGDGKLDLAVANVIDNTISVLLGNGDGTFQSRVTYSAAAGFFDVFNFDLPSLVLGDFNGDGKIDLAVASPNYVSVLLSNGNGTFQSALQSSCSCVAAMAVGDFNGDGKLDLVVTAGGLGGTAGVQGTAVLLGHGDGTFYLNAQYNTSGTEIAVADLNGDGKLDLVITQGSGSPPYLAGQFAVQLGNGDGTFGNPVFYGTEFLSYGVILDDFNGDGKVDVAVTDSCGPLCSGGAAVSIVLGFGDGTFVGATEYNVPTLAGPNATAPILSANFNNGHLDLAVIEGTPSLGVALGNGKGSFQPITSSSTYSTAPSPSAIAAGDLRNNGIVDLVTANNPCPANCIPGTVSVLLGNGDGTFQTHVDYPAGYQPYGVALASFRNNGVLDIAVANYAANTVSILLGNGDGTFQPQVIYATGGGPEQIAVGDFNKDGNLDLAIATWSGASVLLGNGDGTFKSPVGYGPSAQNIITADFNGDGILDLALSVSETTNIPVVILLGNGDGTFQPPITTPIDGGALAAADFNGDGKSDLAVADSFTTNALLALGNGDGTFQAPVSYLIVGQGIEGVVVGDFNGDGAPDWAAGYWTNVLTGGIGVMLSAPFKSISPVSVNFGFQGVGTTSLPRTITISNPSNVKIKINSITATGKFAQTDDCSAGLAPGANCTVNVTFSPTSSGLQSGTINLTDSTRISPLRIPLTGTGVNGPFLTPNPSRMNFPPEPLGRASSPEVLTLVNSGNATLSLNGTIITGTSASDFTQTSNCPSSLNAGGSCNLNVTFTPSEGGTRIAALAVTSSASGSPQTIPLAGTGLAPAVSLSVNSATFAPQTVGTTSAAQTVTLTNTGTATLNQPQIAASGDFAETNTCNAPLDPGNNCQISITFTPSATGNRSGTITINDNAASTPQTIVLAGVGASSDFTIGPAPSSPTSQTITAGQTASFSLGLAGSGTFSGTVNLSCAITPAVTLGPTCSLSSSSEQISGTTAQSVAVKVGTTAPSAAAMLTPIGLPTGSLPWGWTFLCTMMLFGLSGLALQSRKRAPVLVAPVLMLAVLSWVSCGGSSSPHNTQGTPAGTYTATVTATSGSLSHATAFKVTVQ